VVPILPGLDGEPGQNGDLALLLAQCEID